MKNTLLIFITLTICFFPIVYISTVNQDMIHKNSNSNTLLIHNARVYSIMKLKKNKLINYREPKILLTSSVSSVNTSSIGYAWRVKEITYNGVYYEEIFNATTNTWEIVAKLGQLNASGNLVKVIRDPIKNDIVHVFFINTSETIIKGTTSTYVTLKIQHFIINATSQTILSALDYFFALYEFF